MMWRPYYVTAEAAAFEAALVGGEEPRGAGLAAFIGEVAEVMRPGQPYLSERGRERLMAALAAQDGGRKLRGGALAPLRSGALAAATVAGGGLLVVSAATGTTPAEVVREAVQEMPAALGARDGGPSAAPTPFDAIVSGRVAALTNGGFVLESAERRLDVVVGEATVFRRADGARAVDSLSVGDEVEVRGSLDGRELSARVVTVRARELVPTSTPVAAMPSRESTPAEGVRDATATEKPAAAARTPEPTRSATIAAATDVATRSPVATVETATPRPSATPSPAIAASDTTPVPVRTPTRKPTKPTLATAVATNATGVEPGPTEVTPDVPQTATPTPSATPIPTMRPKPSATAVPTFAPSTLDAAAVYQQEPKDDEADDSASDGDSHR